MNIAIIATSPRKNSNSLRFSKYLQKVLKASGFENSTIVDFHHFDIPSVGRGTVQKDDLTLFQAELIGVWEKADLVFFVSPEYNWTVNGDLLNALHQLGSKDFVHLFNNKVFALAGVSNGRGGKVPCLELTTVINKIINFTNQHSVISPRIYESHETAKNLDEHADSTGNHIYENTVKAFVDYALIVAKRWVK
ncbi:MULTISPECIES: NADPH-dependent FMN reductase [Arcicella]|uniref:NAD(P)H-dependent oxidoreductase n=1 Tax=Arcicella lustrica TaxID=2984196 RepID=A0ABU5SLX1_9BACT|nr:NAD(P)H-dependent oxidoreductase [Arcicella sp. DC25W]MEA5428296.1 NAD(P)H-dependent oxidoreductase [Arcicella sp. DC25W]